MTQIRQPDLFDVATKLRPHLEELSAIPIDEKELAQLMHELLFGERQLWELAVLRLMTREEAADALLDRVVDRLRDFGGRMWFDGQREVPLLRLIEDLVFAGTQPE